VFVVDLEKRSFNLTTKLMLWIGGILLCAVCIGSLLFYDYVRDLYITETYQKTDLILGHTGATMEYVRDELRPMMFHRLPKDEFIREAMSTSFVNKGVMARFEKRFPLYMYRRVAVDPINLLNKADAFEEDLIRKFSRHLIDGEWRGLIKRNGVDCFIHAKPVVMEQQCTVCHGNPAYAPKNLTRYYGAEHGYFRQVGAVIGLESITIPVDETFHRIRQVALSVFLLGLAGTVILFLVLNYLYYIVAARPLQRAGAFFKSVVSGGKEPAVKFDVKSHDEIAELATSFNQMVDHLKKSREEQGKMAAKLQQADKLASIGQLAAGVAHEINNPLSVVLGYTKLLMKDIADARVREDLGTIHENATICKEIVEDLLSFSRQKKARSVPADVNDAVESAVSTLEAFCAEKNISLIRNYAASIPLIAMDIDKMKQVYKNILQNACQAIGARGTITVSTRFDDEVKMAAISFADTGCGIPEQIQGRIFEPFFTTKEPGKGTGLGLAVSYGIVSEHNGEITVDSRKGGGAVFTVWLPAEDANQ
jgi:signal transduction histidine kinase